MKKELIIIVYKINIAVLSMTQAQNNIESFLKQNSLSDDIELKEHYIIREIILPTNESDSNVEIIYPISVNKTSKNENNVISEINNLLNNDNRYESIKPYWNKLLREIKLKKLEIDNE